MTGLTWGSRIAGAIYFLSAVMTAGLVQAKELTPELLAEIREIEYFAVSPDGAQVAFEVKTTRENGDRVSDLWLVPADGSQEARPFAASDSDNSVPKWSPDGRRLAFLSKRGESGKRQIFIQDISGEKATQLTSVGTGVDEFAWSPAGDRIAFTASVPTEREGYFTGKGLWLLQMSDKQARVLTPDIEILDFVWSPDGREIAVNSDNELVVVDAGSGEITRVLHRNVSKPWSRRQIFDWSPDGAEILFAELAPTEISPAGIGFWMSVVPAAGGEARPLLKDYPGTITRAVWAADSRHVLAQSFEGTASRLLRVDSETGSVKVLLDEIFDEKSFDVSRDNERFVYTSATLTEPTDLWSYAAETGKRRLTRLNPQFADLDLGAVREVTWTNDDGRMIYGVLVTPPGHRPGGQPLPMIVQLHGGPHFAWWRGWFGSWHDWAQLLAQSGYAVFLPNPRGSTGQGMEFSLANVNDIGEGPLSDVLAGVRMLIDEGVADPDRLGVGGWSYGGYLTAWTITQTSMFKAAIVGTGISRVTKRSTMLLKEYYGNIDVRERYRHLTQVSPDHFLHEVHTPTLIIHGEEDHKIDQRQAVELYDGLQELGVESELVLYPGEGHGIENRKHRIDMLRRVVDWYDRHVK